MGGDNVLDRYRDRKSKAGRSRIAVDADGYRGQSSTFSLHSGSLRWMHPRVYRLQLLFLMVVTTVGCGLLREKEPSPEATNLQKGVPQIAPEDAPKVLSEVGENWLYGPGLGQTALNVGAIVVFPPYAIYVLGNSLLSMSGYEPLYVSNLLPDDERAEFNEMYDEVTTAPGRVSAALAGKEFRSKEVASQRMKAIVSEDGSSKSSPINDDRG
jgi:hypothetical protein